MSAAWTRAERSPRNSIGDAGRERLSRHCPLTEATRADTFSLGKHAMKRSVIHLASRADCVAWVALRSSSERAVHARPVELELAACISACCAFSQSCRADAHCDDMSERHRNDAKNNRDQVEMRDPSDLKSPKDQDAGRVPGSPLRAAKQDRESSTPRATALPVARRPADLPCSCRSAGTTLEAR